MSVVTIFNRNGAPLTEIRTLVTSMSWVLNGVGEASFTLAMLDPKAQQKYLEFGRYIEIQQGKLPLWAGLIDPDREWDGSSITVKAYSGEYLLELRGTDERKILKGSAGDLFRQLIAIANAEENLLIREGAIDSKGEKRQEELGKSVLEHVEAVAERTGNDFGINPERDNKNRLYFTADWYPRRGVKRGFILREGLEGANMERTPGRKLMVERGPIVNRLTGLGDANTKGTRIRSVQEVDSSIAQYGLRTASEVFDGNKEAGTLAQSTREAVKKMAWPKKVYYVTALDVGDLFYDLRLGRVGTLDMANVGFEGSGFGGSDKVRILGMKYLEGPRKCELTLEQERD